MIPFYRKAAAAILLLLSSTTAWSLDIPAGSSVTIPAGSSISLACTNLNVDGSLFVTSGQVDQALNIGITSTGTINGGSGAVSVGGSWNNTGSFIAGTSTVTFQDGCSALPGQLTGDTTFYNLTLSSSSGRTIVLPAGAHITVLGTLNLQGVTLASSSSQTAIVTLGPAAHLVSSGATIPPTVRIGTQAQLYGIPTLNGYGLVILILLLVAMAAWQLNVFPLARRPGREESHGA